MRARIFAEAIHLQRRPPGPPCFLSEPLSRLQAKMAKLKFAFFGRVLAVTYALYAIAISLWFAFKNNKPGAELSLIAYSFAAGVLALSTELPSCFLCCTPCKVVAMILRVVMGYWVVRAVFYAGLCRVAGRLHSCHDHSTPLVAMQDSPLPGTLSMASSLSACGTRGCSPYRCSRRSRLPSTSLRQYGARPIQHTPGMIPEETRGQTQ